MIICMESFCFRKIEVLGSGSVSAGSNQSSLSVDSAIKFSFIIFLITCKKGGALLMPRGIKGSGVAKESSPRPSTIDKKSCCH